MKIEAPLTRIVALACAIAFVAIGLVVRFAGPGGHAAQFAGTALYASMVYAGVVLVAPRMAPVWSGAIAVGCCWLVETFQLSGIPAELATHSRLARLVLGREFDWADLAWYPVGVVPLVLVHWLAKRQPDDKVNLF